MRLLERNKTEYYYAVYTGDSEVRDSEGFYTGEHLPTYTEPEKVKDYITAGRGVSDAEQFGVNVDYSRKIYTENMERSMCDTQVFWLGVPPTEPYNYELAAPPIKTLNHIVYAIRQVNRGLR